MAKKKTTKKKAATPIMTMTGFTNAIYTPGAMPYSNNVRKRTLTDTKNKTVSITGTICVKGKATLDDDSPDEAQAKIYRTDPGVPDPAPPAGAQVGVVGNFNEFGIVYNYRFIRNDPVDLANHDVDNAQGGHSQPGSNRNWLVVWLRFDATWHHTKLQFHGFKATATECETSVSSLR